MHWQHKAVPTKYYYVERLISTQVLQQRKRPNMYKCLLHSHWASDIISFILSSSLILGIAGPFRDERGEYVQDGGTYSHHVFLECKRKRLQNKTAGLKTSLVSCSHS